MPHGRNAGSSAGKHRPRQTFFNFGGGPDGADGNAFLEMNAVEKGEGGEVALQSSWNSLLGITVYWV